MVPGLATVVGTILCCFSICCSGAVWKRRGGGPCTSDDDCFSGICYNFFQERFCGPEAATEGGLAGGSTCTFNKQCYSNYCYNMICAPDSRIKGKIADGGVCDSQSANQCLSGYCNYERCMTGSGDPMTNLLAGGAPCTTDAQCYSGYCYGQANHVCAPDGRFPKLVPSGGPCDKDERCASGSCWNGQCAVEDELMRGRVADGGRCNRDDQCKPNSICREHFCGGTVAVATTGDAPIRKPGDRCEYTHQCANKTPCLHQRCATPSLFNASLAADGGDCFSLADCSSGHCHKLCRVSHDRRRTPGSLASGEGCSRSSDCYSNSCVRETCSPVSPVRSLVNVTGHRVAAGGSCELAGSCYSGVCRNQVCSADSSRLGFVAGGGYCEENRNCASGYCLNRTCVAASKMTDRVAGGGRCVADQQCEYGNSCRDNFCRSNADYETRKPGPLPVTDADCWTYSQCTSGQCLDGQCRWPVFLLERSSANVGRRSSVLAIFASIWMLTLFW